MDIKQLTYFRMIVEEGNVTRAAKRLFMAQPSLSQQLKLLEAELGAKLLERGNRRVRLTQAGQILYDRAGVVLDLLRATKAEVQEVHEGYRGTLMIGTIASSGVTLLPGLIREFHEKHPKIRFQLREGDTQQILELLSSGSIEIGIVRSAFDLGLYHWIDLPPEPMIVAMTQKGNQRADNQPITIAELVDKPLLLHRSNELMIRECCQNFGFEPNILCIGDDIRTLLVLANEGIGLALVPKSALGLIPSHHLEYREMIDSPLKIKKAVVWLQQRELSATAKHFLNTLFAERLPVKEL